MDSWNAISAIFAIQKKGEHTNAQVAKLVDALCSGRSVRKDVLVRIQSWALALSE